MRRVFAVAVLCLFIISCAGMSHRKTTRDRELIQRIESARKEYNLPAMAVAVVWGDRIVAVEASGIRHMDSAEPVSVDDRFHLGSCTKGMVATLAATFVEEGKIAWDTRPSDLFPELRDTIHPDYRTITLRDLLTHRAGLPSVSEWDELRAAPRSFDLPVKQRRDYAVKLLRQTPFTKPHGEFVYSNAGYAIAGAMLEQVGGKPWTALLTERVFKPLGMKHAGFKWPALMNVHQPWGHYRDDDKDLSAIVIQQPDSSRVVPVVIEPCGDVNASMEDFAKFVRFHMLAYRGRDSLLKASTVRYLHDPIDEYYALGWAFSREVKGHTISRHAGSCGNFMALMAFSHEQRVGVVVATNIGGSAAETACNKVMAETMLQYSK